MRGAGTLPLFAGLEGPARARRADPETSHEAAQGVEDSGTAAGQRAICLRAVRRSPGSTAAEVAAATGLERHAPSRRLPELREGGVVVNGEPRCCRIVSRRSLTWYVPGGGER